MSERPEQEGQQEGQQGAQHGAQPDTGRGTGHEQPTELRDSNPNAAGPERASGGMGVSSERVGPVGGGTKSTDGEKDTTEPVLTDQAGDLIGSDAEFDQEAEHNPAGLGPKAGYPSHDPRSEERPFKDA
jgi:hypothetical protein